MNRQPGYPKGQWVEPTLPVEEANPPVLDTTDLRTPEQKKWPVVRFGPNGRLERVSEAPPPADPPRADN